MSHEKKAFLLALVAVLCWSTIGSAFRLSLNYLPPHQLIFYAVITSLLSTGSYIMMRGTGRRLFAFTPKQYAYSAMTAFINPFVYYLMLLHGYDILPTQVAGTINYMWPILLVLLSTVVLKQKTGFRAFFACFISFCGLVLIVTRGNFNSLSYSNPAGVGLILCSSCLFALYWILNMKDHRESADKLILTYFFATLYLIPVQFLMPEGWTLPPWRGVTGAIYIGIFEMGFTFIVWLNALRLTTNTARISNLVFLSPFLSLLFISIFIGETIAFTTFVGLIFIVTGIILSNTQRKSSQLEMSKQTVRRRFYSFLLKCMGWKGNGALPQVPKCVLIVAPHTSIWDFIISYLYYTSIGGSSSVLIKKEFFFWPIGGILKRCGAIPVDRSKGAHIVRQAVQAFQTHETLQIAIALEGTRKPTDKWKRGFHTIATTAGVPVYLCFYDWQKKEIGIAQEIQLTNDPQADLKRIRQWYKDKGVVGKYPKNFITGTDLD